MENFYVYSAPLNFLERGGREVRVIHKVCTLSFRNFRCTCTYAFSLHHLPQSKSAQILFFKEDMPEIYFANYYQSKNQKQCYKRNKLLYKAIGKCQIAAPRRALGSSLRFNCTARWDR